MDQYDELIDRIDKIERESKSMLDRLNSFRHEKYLSRHGFKKTQLISMCEHYKIGLPSRIQELSFDNKTEVNLDRNALMSHVNRHLTLMQMEEYCTIKHWRCKVNSAEEVMLSLDLRKFTMNCGKVGQYLYDSSIQFIEGVNSVKSQEKHLEDCGYITDEQKARIELFEHVSTKISAIRDSLAEINLVKEQLHLPLPDRYLELSSSYSTEETNGSS